MTRLSLCALAVAAGSVVVLTGQSSPALTDYYTQIAPRVIDRDYVPKFIDSSYGAADFNGDGQQDIVVLGADYPRGGTTYEAQGGRLFLGNGDGAFTAAPANQFPVDTLRTVHPRKLLLNDLNGDRRADLFVASHGWDTNPFPGEQNRLYLSQPGGGWKDETGSLPQLSDFSHSAAAGDLSGRGITDIIAGNGYAGQNRVLAYTLLNSGSGQFSMTRSNLPVGSGETLDTLTTHNYALTELMDLDGDALPELIVGADTRTGFRNTGATIFWNRAGSFVESDKTRLPVTAAFPDNHIDYDATPIDVNRDGRQDLLMVGTLGQPISGGWYIQVLVNKGDHRFEDESAIRLQEGTVASTGVTWPKWVRVIDFNHDGAQDFYVEFTTTSLSREQPVVWLNDGAGKFSVLRISDFVPSGREFMVNPLHLIETRQGYSAFTLQSYSGSGGLVLTGLLASRPYTGFPRR